jgi:hypothetical protein
MTRRLALLVALAGCRHAQVAQVVAPAPGVSIALYDRGDGSAYGVVDDRRWVEVTAGHPIILDNIDPGATLPSLVIEQLGGAPLSIGACSRDVIERAEPTPAAEQTREQRRIAALRRRLREVTDEPPPLTEEVKPVVAARPGAPTVSCALDRRARAGRYLVRVLYVSTTLQYRAQHELAMTSADRATLGSHFAIVTPPWHERGDITLFDGVPGGDRPPREVARGPITLDGSTAVLAAPPRELAAHLRRIYDGALLVAGVPATELMWNHRSHPSVWVWAELDDARLAPGPVRAHVALPGETPRDIDIPAVARKSSDPAGVSLRLPLWEDPDLRGMRQPGVDYADNASLADRLLYSITNVGSVPHDVWIEEHLRPAKRRRVVRAWPSKPAVHDDTLRTKLTIPPGKIERAGYTVDYDF